MITYEQAVKNQAKAAAAYEKVAAKLRAANSDLEAAKRELTCKCSVCHHEIKVKDIELIDKTYGGYRSYDTYDGEWNCSHSIFWVCPMCHVPLAAPANEGPWIQGFHKYVKTVHEWDSDHERCHGRVLELMGPHLKSEAAREAKEEKERKIREAKKLLEAEGILGNTTA